MSGVPGQDAEFPADVPLPSDWRVPDDARDLELDRLAWRRERAARARRRWLHLLTPGGGGGPLRPGAVALLVGAVLVMSAVTMLAPLVLAHPGGSRSLARPPIPAGQVGGLLPATALTIDGQSTPARSLRPAVVALVPEPCPCNSLLDELSARAEQFGLPVVLVTRSPAQLAPLLSAVVHGRVVGAYDARGTLSATYLPRGVTLLLVDSHGVVRSVDRQLRSPAALDGQLNQIAD